VAVFALINEFLLINAVNLSDHVKEATLTLDADQLDSTAMGDSWKEITGGLKGGQLKLTFNDDYAAASVDSTLWPLFGTVTTFEVRTDAGARSATNPAYTGSIFIAQHSAGGQLNELAAKGPTFPTSGPVLRQTA
jgi:hypothetical protein